MNLVFGHDASVAAWAATRYSAFRGCDRALGIVRGEGALLGAATFHNLNGSNVDLCYWGPGTVTLSVARGIARFAFDDLGVNRITAMTQRNNRRVKEGLPRIGFRFEGVLRHYYGPERKNDGIVFGLLREHADKLLGHR